MKDSEFQHKGASSFALNDLYLTQETGSVCRLDSLFDFNFIPRVDFVMLLESETITAKGGKLKF
jgi:hypothetical protein